jgi:hypothetical protein
MRKIVPCLLFGALTVGTVGSAAANCFTCRNSIHCEPGCQVDHVCTEIATFCTDCTTQCDDGPGACQRNGSGCQWTYQTPVRRANWFDDSRQSACSDAGIYRSAANPFAV